MVTTYSGHELVNDHLSDLVYAVIIVTILRELAGGLEVGDDTVLITDNFNLSILDS